MNFAEFRAFGLTEKRSTYEFRIYKNRYDFWNMSIPVGTGDITSIIWQGESLLVTTDKGWRYVFTDFNTWQAI